MFSIEKFEKALFFATRAHDGQKLDEPKDMAYSAHLCAVTCFAIDACHQDCKNPDWDLLVQVALLHDTIEDTGTSYEALKKAFGQQVADGVLALSKNPKVEKSMQLLDVLNA